MKYLIISGNPKHDGLCSSVMNEIKRGASDGGAEVEILTVESIERCHCCGNGWGYAAKITNVRSAMMDLVKHRKQYGVPIYYASLHQYIGVRWQRA